MFGQARTSAIPFSTSPGDAACRFRWPPEGLPKLAMGCPNLAYRTLACSFNLAGVSVPWVLTSQRAVLWQPRRPVVRKYCFGI